MSSENWEQTPSNPRPEDLVWIPGQAIVPGLTPVTENALDTRLAAIQSEVDGKVNTTDMIMVSRMFPNNGSYNYTRTLWLRAQDFIGTLNNGDPVTLWEPPTGYSGLWTAVGVTGTGPAVTFVHTPATESVPYVLTSGSSLSYLSVNHDGPKMVTVATTGFTMFVVWRRPNTTGEVWIPRIDGTVATSQFRIISLGANVNTYLYRTSTNATTSVPITANTWNVTGVRVTPSNRILTMLAWNTTTKLPVWTSVDATVNIDRGDLDIVQGNNTHFAFGTGTTTAHLAEIQMFNSAFTDADFSTTYANLRSRYNVT